MHELIIFTAAFASVFLGCFQAINVVRGRYVWAMLTSVAQSGASLTLYRTVPSVTTLSAAAAFCYRRRVRRTVIYARNKKDSIGHETHNHCQAPSLC